MPRSLTNNRIWGDVEQFDTRKAVVEVSLYYLAFVVVGLLLAVVVVEEATEAALEPQDAARTPTAKSDQDLFHMRMLMSSFVNFFMN